MKKIIALALAIIMLFALSGCGKKSEILGTYETTLELTGAFDDVLASDPAFEGSGFSLSDYVEGLEIVMVSQFNEDGTYFQYFDPDASVETLEKLKTAVMELMDDFMLYSFRVQMGEVGITVEQRSDVEELLGMAWDEILYSTSGVTLEELVDEMIVEFGLLTDGSKIAEGNYKAEGGKIYMSTSLDSTYDTSAYKTYELDGENVIITSSVGIEPDPSTEEILSYPFTLVKVA